MTSLRLRLILLFTLAISLIWGIAGSFAFFESRSYINEFFDTQQMLFARHLAASKYGDTAEFPRRRIPRSAGKKEEKGRFEDDALGFAIFDRHGRLLMDDGENGSRFAFELTRRGFVETPLQKKNGKKGDLWRIVWLDSVDGNFIIAVGQEQDYRRDLALGMLSRQLLPWALGFPVLLILVFFSVSRELAPLKRVTGALERRQPEDAAPLNTDAVPSEVRPLVKALNRLFARTSTLLVRERAFISDAAHELRSPLAALRVQTEVAQLAGDDPETLSRALAHLITGIDRATRLIEQLLTLSRLEAIDETADAPEWPMRETMLPFQPLDWVALINTAIREQQANADAKGIRITFTPSTALEQSEGSPLLIALLLRNVFDNAVRYTPPGGTVTARLDTVCLAIANSGPGLSEHDLSRLGERFFRPPGQEQNGSGLGLSIVTRIARLHGWNTEFFSKAGEGVQVNVSFKSSQPWHNA